MNKRTSLMCAAMICLAHANATLADDAAVRVRKQPTPR